MGTGSVTRCFVRVLVIFFDYCNSCVLFSVLGFWTFCSLSRRSCLHIPSVSPVSHVSVSMSCLRLCICLVFYFDSPCPVCSVSSCASSYLVRSDLPQAVLPPVRHPLVVRLVFKSCVFLLQLLCCLFASCFAVLIVSMVRLFVLHEFIWWSVFPSNKAAIRFRVRVLQLGPPSCLLHSKPWHWEEQHLSLLLIVECNLCFAQRFHCDDRQNCIVKVKLMRNHGVIILWQVHCPIKISFKLIRWCQK